VLNTRIPIDYIPTKITLNNYDGLTDPREHIQNVRNSLELVIQDNHTIWKIILMTFKGVVRVWYNNIKPGSIANFNDLKLVGHFSTSISAKVSFNELFGIT
jgi:hypothetical protein